MLWQLVVFNSCISFAGLGLSSGKRENRLITGNLCEDTCYTRIIHSTPDAANLFFRSFSLLWEWEAFV